MMTPLVRRLLPGVAKAAVLAAGVVALLLFMRHRSDADIPVADDDDVNVSPLVGVQTGKVTRATLRAYADVYGTVEVEPGRDGRAAADADVSVPMSAVVASVACVEGQRVAAGQVLFKLDDRAAEAAVNRANAVHVAADHAASLLAGGQGYDTARLERDAAVAAADLARALADRERLTVVAPIAGTVVGLNVRAGAVVSGGATAVRVVDLERLVVATAVPAGQLADVRVGAAAEIYLDGRTAAGTVSFVDPAVDPLTGDGSVDVSTDASLRLGQVLRVRLVTAEHRDVLAVPMASVVEDAAGAASIRSIERDFRWAVRVPVNVGVRDGGLVEVAGEGLREGQDVVTVGAFAVPEHARIEVAK